MPFTATPLSGGDAFDLAARIAQDADAALTALPAPEARAACLQTYWARLVELGWTATAIAEEAGGAGGGLADLAALAGGAGRAALPLPVAGACAVVPHLLGAAPANPLLAQVADGAARVCPILPGNGALTLAEERLSGSAVGVETPPAPTHVLAVVGDALVLLAADAPGVACAMSLRIDRRLAADWSFGASPSIVLARGAAVLARAEEARDLGALLTCVEATEAAGALIEQTIAYLSTRIQFGAPLGSNQALRHRVAEMYVEYETLRGLVGAALRQAESGAGAAWRDIAFAKLRLGHAGRSIAEAAIQCHGGMGLTEDLPATRLARRILMAEFEYGDGAFQARRLLSAGA
jgi:alkylation response protein AidB-like acyl-CoA dehydrogenase